MLYCIRWLQSNFLSCVSLYQSTAMSPMSMRALASVILNFLNSYFSVMSIRWSPSTVKISTTGTTRALYRTALCNSWKKSTMTRLENWSIWSASWRAKMLIYRKSTHTSRPQLRARVLVVRPQAAYRSLLLHQELLSLLPLRARTMLHVKPTTYLPRLSYFASTKSDSSPAWRSSRSIISNSLANWENWSTTYAQRMVPHRWLAMGCPPQARTKLAPWTWSLWRRHSWLR